MQNNNGRFFDGLLIGAILGGGVVFLLGTKKGNRVLKVLSEGGFENLTQMFEDFKDGIKQGVKKTTKDIEKRELKDIEKMEEKIENEAPKENGVDHKTGTRRFFRKS